MADNQKTMIIAGVAVAVIIIFAVLFINTRTQAGQAVYIGEAPWAGGQIDLFEEETITFTALPDESAVLDIVAGSSAVERADRADYELELTPLENAYSYVIRLIQEDDTTIEIARDVVEAGEVTSIYLDIGDAAPDFEISYLNDQITFRNLHYISSDLAEITLNDEDGTALNTVIPVEEEATLIATIEASSTSAPDNIAVFVSPVEYANTITLGTLVRDTDNAVSGRGLSFTAPDESTAIVLDIVATVSNEETHRYYTLAVGDIAYALDQPDFPEMEYDSAAAELTVTFKATQELQPFSLPCELPVAPPDSTQANELFSDNNIARVYTYDTRQRNPLIWTQGGPSEITDLSPFQGYFIELTDAEETSITIGCTIQSFQSLSTGPPGLVARTHRLWAGWNLFSVPGTVPRPLTDFTNEENFRVFECRQDYDCAELAIDSLLNPGKPYWIFTERPFTIGFT